MHNRHESRSSYGYYDVNLHDYDESRNTSGAEQNKGRVDEADQNETYFQTTLHSSFFVKKEVSPGLKPKKKVLKIT